MGNGFESSSYTSRCDIGAELYQYQNEYDSGELWEEIELLINNPTAATMSLSSLLPNNEPYGHSYNMHEQLGSIDQCMIKPGKGKSAAGPEPALGGGELVELGLSEQQPVVESDALSRRRDIGSSSHNLPVITVAEKQNKTKLSLEKRKTIHQKIGVEDLERHFGRTRTEASKSLNVSVPTLKRICRLYGIPRWPFNKKNKVLNMSVKVDEGAFGQNSLTTSLCLGVQPGKGNQSAAHLMVAPGSMLPETEIEQIPESGQTNTPPPTQLATEMMVVHISPPETVKQDERLMIVKVKYRDDFVKFELSSLSKMVDLEQGISKRLKLKVGSFKIMYLDEERDWVLIACDEDLRYCMRSVGGTTIKMLVLSISNRQL